MSTPTTRPILPVLGRGVAFPLRPTPARPPTDLSGVVPTQRPQPQTSPWSTSSGGLRWLDGEDKVRQSIWLILSTAPGERLMRPEFGCGIQDLVFKPNTEAFRSLVREKVVESLTRYEPRIDVVEVTVTAPSDQRNRMDISIDYRLRQNNAFFNLVYPFYLEEGTGVSS